MDYQFNNRDREVLKAVGRSEAGRELVLILEKLRDRMSSVEGITGDYGAQVEGRKIFRDLCRTLIEEITHRKSARPETEGNDDYGT